MADTVKNIELKEHLWRGKVFFLEDILHSGKSGKEYVPKVGEVFDLRRNRFCKIDHTRSGQMCIELFD